MRKDVLLEFDKYLDLIAKLNLSISAVLSRVEKLEQIVEANNYIYETKLVRKDK